MNRIPKLLRASLTLVASVLLIFAVASPAFAAPAPFSLSDIGEDACTHYATEGVAEWPNIVLEPTVEIAGLAATTVDTTGHCLDVVPQPRHIEFIAYAEKDVVDWRAVPLAGEESKFEYAFDLTTAEYASITHVTVAICVTGIIIGPPSQDCTEVVELSAS
jgi:hypothetical protein